ncbi:MAG: CBS domain-containing protein [Flavobacteriaceae bacterium]|nr:CBS domain-containing protein [Flavobacteriaceae bacterium]
MGNLKVTKLSSKKEKASYIYQLIKDIEALDVMIKEGLIEKSPIRIGAEQEFCLVNSEFFPKSNSLDILKEINDDHFTTEIGNYNLEINLDPFELKEDCFSKLHHQLSSLLNKVKTVAKKKDTKILLTGILPTLSLKHTKEENMTPIQRYYVLNEAIKESRKQDFYIHIKGVDEVNLLQDSIMLEGCNTSFHMHLQVNPNDFIENYNWAQAISGPILSACTNSPLLFGKELWSETRIALFTQSVDTRANSFLLNQKQSRVSFGSEWSTGTITDIFRDNVSRFRSLVTFEFKKDSIEMLQDKEIPNLMALRLHNGTVYRWNRPCYGIVEGKPHIRIENRYIPSGPSVIDEIANLMLWVGVMIGKPKQYKNIEKKMDFKDVKSNFFCAARYGMATQLYWNNKYITSEKLILDELLPMAYIGLRRAGILSKDIEYYLTIIENRVKSHNGSQWIKKSYRNLLKSKRPLNALQTLTSSIYKKQETDFPISTWNLLQQNTQSVFKKRRIVKHVMSTDIFSVDENDSIELVLNIMQWKNIHHMPVIDPEKKLIGLLTKADIKTYLNNNKKLQDSIKFIMKKEVISISQHSSLKEAKAIMQKHKIKGLPVVKYNKLIGIITTKDILD